MSDEKIATVKEYITTQIDDRIKKYKEDPIDKILEIYHKDIIEIIDKETDEEIKEIRENSELGKIFSEVLKYSQKKIKTTYPDNYEKMKDKIYINFDNDEETQRKIDDKLSERNEKIDALNDVLKDVKAMIGLTETYEQKIDILKKYGIIDEDGLLV